MQHAARPVLGQTAGDDVIQGWEEIGIVDLPAVRKTGAEIQLEIGAEREPIACLSENLDTGLGIRHDGGVGEIDSDAEAKCATGANSRRHEVAEKVAINLGAESQVGQVDRHRAGDDEKRAVGRIERVFGKQERSRSLHVGDEFVDELSRIAAPGGSLATAPWAVMLSFV